ncbi:MAG: Nif3-like dinuclear metal center hexameric protein [Clostridia bacterium]|nr:Nif3-like dinuclear metal center hexameric protein [Clostridia bacterium]
MTFYELYKAMEMKIPLDLRCEWDNDGIMCVDNLEKKVKRVLIALDVTADTVNHAIENSYDTIISHHPLVFRAQKAITPMSYTQDKLISLIQGKVGVMSFHTRLDAVKGGVNDALSSVLGLTDVTVDLADPIGRIGHTKETKELSQFAREVKDALGSPFVLYSGQEQVSKVYVVGGDGKDLIDNAVASGCDTIVTGRASYNTSIDASDMGINIIEAGHFYTENPVCKILKSMIKSIDATIVADIYCSNRIKAI